MRWCCFLFWFIYRLTLACLAHFNFLVAIYVNCAYFLLWKSYDLLWFWMHLMLCSCFKPLRSENYLIVWCNLLFKHLTRYPDKTYKEIYMLEYGKLKHTKAERELQRIGTVEVREREVEEHDSSSSDEGDAVPERPPLDNPNRTHETCVDDKEDGDIGGEQTEPIAGVVPPNGVSSRPKLSAFRRVSREEVIAEEERECQEQCFVGHAVSSYPNLERRDQPDFDEAAPVRPPRKKQTEEGEQLNEPNEGSESGLSVEIGTRVSWFNRFPIPRAFRDRLRSDSNQATAEISPQTLTTDVEADSGGTGGWSNRINFQKILPDFLLRRSSSSEEGDGQPEILRPDFTNIRDLKSKKAEEKRAKRDKKALTKRLRERRRAELAIIAKRERREKLISNAIELLLQILRMMTSFAILVGNIRKTFIPASFKYLKPGQHAHDNPGLVLLFRCTVFLDVLLFWTAVIWTYCLQWHLCCRLGLCKFWMWTLILMSVGGFVMLLPMSYVQNSLDVSWCRFLPNSSLAKYQPVW